MPRPVMATSTAPVGRASWSPLVSAAYALAIVAFLASVWRFHDADTGWTRLIHFPISRHEAETAAVRSAPHAHEGGYDGAFYAQLAVDPLLRTPDIDRALDGPGYRARRILFSWTAYVLGGGDPARVLRAYAAQNVVFWVALALLLTRWFPPTGARSLVSWLSVLFGFGTIESVRMALLDGPSLFVIALAVVAVETGRHTIGAAVLGVSALGRETNLLAGPILLARPRGFRGGLALAARIVLVVGPLLLWMDYLYSIYRSTLDVSGAGNFGLPFAGYADKVARTFVRVARAPEFSRGGSTGLVIVSLTAQVGVIAGVRAWHSPWWRVGAGFAVLVVLAGPAIWAGWPGAMARVVLPLSVAANVHLPWNSRWGWPVAVACNVGAIAGLGSLARL